MSVQPVAIKRVYDEAAAGDGLRILVDRVWPRGVSKEHANLYEWCKAVSPSTDLRKWYSHDPEKFAEFKNRYVSELSQGDRAEALEHLRQLLETEPLTLLTGSKALEISQAAVLAQILNPD